MKTKITIKDIAKELDISASTVSRALQDNKSISEETRQKVQAFAKLYNYKPNKLALKLRNRKTMVIGVIIPEIVHHFFSEIIYGVEKVANNNDYNVMICLSNESYAKEVLNMKMLADGSVDGLIISIAKETLQKGDFDHFHELLGSNIPLVLFDRVTDEIECDQVIVDDIGGGYNATKHLIDTGMRQIAILTTPDYVNVGRLRTEGYKKALEEYSITVEEDLILRIKDDDSFREQIAAFFERDFEYPLGVFAVNEIYAATAMKIAKKKGLSIPEDVAIIGYTNGLISEFVSPSLSTVVQHGFTIGERAAELMLQRISTSEQEIKKFEKRIITTDLNIRGSSQKNEKVSL